MILEGLPIGNLFGLAWNLLVSTSFQFVGFLLTYLLHTTHAAKCGSRAGLGITLVQYGYYLQSAAGKAAAHAGSGKEDKPASDADQLAEDGKTPVSNDSDMLSYILIALGSMIVVSSLFSYWAVYRWGYQLVSTARREQAAREEAEAAEAAAVADGTTPEATAAPANTPPNFVDRLRGIFGDHLTGTSRNPAEAEDWVIFPGAGRRLTDLEEGRAGNEESMTQEEARLLRNLRNSGMID